jgi:hypothetical protein
MSSNQDKWGSNKFISFLKPSIQKLGQVVVVVMNQKMKRNPQISQVVIADCIGSFHLHDYFRPHKATSRDN